MSANGIAVLQWGPGPVATATGPAPAWTNAARAMENDLDQVRRCLEGDEDAFARLMRQYQPRVSAMMWRFTRDPIVHRDLVQDVFVDVYRSLHRYGGRAPLEHWLSRIATRTGYKHWKRRQREPARVPVEDWDGAVSWDPAELDPDRASATLYEVLALLAPRDRLVLTLRYFEDLSVTETARRTGWTETMVKVQSHRARTRLKTLLERTEPEKAQ